MGNLSTTLNQNIQDFTNALIEQERSEASVGDIGRLGEPLRVAIAGKVKAGKSTLLNALVGDELAPTDAGA